MRRLALLLVAVVAVGCAKKRPLPIFLPLPPVAEVHETFVPVAPDMGNVYFDTDKYELREDAVAVLVINIGLLQGFDVTNIAVHGHADERHTRLYNLILGQDRANAVAQYLQAHGFKTTATTYGEARPVCNDSVESCWWQNRRVVLEVTLEE